MKRKSLAIVTLAFVHYIVSIALVLAASRVGYDNFDRYTPYTTTDTIISRLADISIWPIYALSMWIGLGRFAPLHLVLELLNSLLWDMGLYPLLSAALRVLQTPRKTAI